MKPDWDKLSDEYKESTSVVVADVDCTKHEDICSEQGVEGYPTIKYWLDGTPEDYNGGRDFSALKKFVDETLVRNCAITDLDQCSEKEQGYHGKISGWDLEKQKKELERLQGMKGGSMKPDLKKWLFQRINLLNQVVEK